MNSYPGGVQTLSAALLKSYTIYVSLEGLVGGLTLPGYIKKMSYSNREAYVMDILPNCLLSFPVNEVL